MWRCNIKEIIAELQLTKETKIDDQTDALQYNSRQHYRQEGNEKETRSAEMWSDAVVCRGTTKLRVLRKRRAGLNGCDCGRYDDWQHSAVH